MEIVERRQYRKEIVDILEVIKRTKTAHTFTLRPSKQYFSIFNGNIDKIGILPSPLPGKIVSTYIFAFSALEDFELTKEDFINDWQISARHLENLLTILDLAIQSAEEVQRIIVKKGLLLT